MRAEATPPLLEVEAVCAGYGHVPVLRDVTVHVDAGEIVTLVGANGSGKSTLLRAIMGVLRPSSGTVRFAGEDVTRVPPEHMVRRGVALVPEGRMLFGAMTVEENLLLGAHARGRAEYPESLARVVRLFPVLAERLRQSAATLSGGEQQMLAVGRALMSRPTVLLLDEPSLGLAPKVISEIFATLDTLRNEGLTVLLVEQDVRVALRHADHGYVMRTGQIVMEGPASKLLAEEHIRHIYLGTWDDSPAIGAGDAREGS
jgi:branched-chain amino acid transport system ATP-binding protein